LKALGTTRSKELITHSHTHFRRVYPQGTRIDSSNLDPVACWRNGSQIAALNWQYFDRYVVVYNLLAASPDRMPFYPGVCN